MTLLTSNVRAIIFDLGGVIVDLSVEKTAQAFSALSGLPTRSIMEAYSKYPDFFAYERGELNDANFRERLRGIFSLRATDAQIDECWNAMLLGVPHRKLQLVNRLREQFSVYVLSNTNNIHIRCLNDTFLNETNLESYFHKSYYSHEVGMRKPEIEIYKHVLDDAELVADQTLFLDDNLENIQAATRLGIKAIHIKHPDEVYELLNSL